MKHVTAILLGAALVLSWVDNSDNEIGFRVYRAPATGVDFLFIGSVGEDVTTYTDTGLPAETEFKYLVTAWNDFGESDPSNMAMGRTERSGAAPNSPFELEVKRLGQISNMSMRAMVGTGDGILIPGIIVTVAPVRVLVRAVGPTLGEAPFNVPGVLEDPVIQMIGGAFNDDWAGEEVSEAAIAVEAFPLPVGSKDAALVITLQPGAHTLHVSGKDGSVGIVLVEVYKLP